MGSLTIGNMKQFFIRMHSCRPQLAAVAARERIRGDEILPIADTR
jgi:hypothetical protein